jgi:membrane protein
VFNINFLQPHYDAEANLTATAMLDNKISQIITFFKKDIWEFPQDSFWKRALRIGIMAVQNFNRDECFLKASALTFYSLLSIVPTLAVFFAFAKGFGFTAILEREIQGQFHEQPEIAQKLIDFSYSMLSQAQGGIITGVGIVVLFWTIIKLLGNIESSLNDIWKVPAPRSFLRKLSDYLAIIIFCPIFFALSSSLAIYITSQVMKVTHRIEFLDAYSYWIFLFLHIIPYVLCWLLFSFIYLFMPNTKVPWRYAILAGIIAGTAYQILQLIYIRFQIGASSYGAIYGSFAALPLFLVWINLSWLIVLAGAEIAYAAENDSLTYGMSGQTGKSRTLASKEVLGLLIVDQCVQTFCKANPPLSIAQLSNQLGAAEKNVDQVVGELVQAHVLSEVKGTEANECYQPARNVKDIRIKLVADALNVAKRTQVYVYANPALTRMEETLAAFDKDAENSNVNISID